MPIPLYLEFDSRPIQVCRLALIGSTSSKEFRIALPKRPKRVLSNAEQDILASEVIINGK